MEHKTTKLNKDVTRTQSVSTNLLKQYLEAAEKGKNRNCEQFYTCKQSLEDFVMKQKKQQKKTMKTQRNKM